MGKNNLGLKLRGAFLYQLLLERIAEAKKPNSDIISFPALFSSICVKFSIPKKQVWDVLLLLHDLNIITIVTGHGVKLNVKLKEVKGK